MRRIGIAALALLVAGPALARELPAFYRGVRPLGMGGAFTAVADDDNAVFYNPAGLDKVERWRMGILNPLVEVNYKGIDFAKDVEDTDLNEPAEVTQLLRDNIGDYLHVRAALYPNFSIRHFAVGVLGQATLNAQPNNVAFPELEVREAMETVSGHFGTGWGFFDGVLRIGGAVKYVDARGMRDVIYTAADIAADDFDDQVKDDLKHGSGFGFDVGAMVEFPVVMKPTLAATVQNVGDLDLGDAGEIPQQMNLGIALSHAFSWVTLTGAADYVDITKKVGVDDDPYKRIHMGVEARMWNMVSLRGGFNQGYGTFGATLDFKALRIDYANYAEEIGSAAGDRSDRRHALQVTLGW